MNIICFSILMGIILAGLIVAFGVFVDAAAQLWARRKDCDD